jgi:hypothetical protein
MASSIQLLRSNNAQERPFPGNLLDGQPAINTNPQEPGLFFKANNETIIKIGPAAITSDGNPPNAGAVGQSGNTVGELWLDKSLPVPVLKVYDGAQWVDAGSGGGGSPGVVTLQRWVKTAAGGETSISGPDNSAQILSYTPELEEVFLNGVLLTRGVDYFTPSGTSITSFAPLTAGDEVTVLGWTPFTVLGPIDGSDLVDNTVTSAKIQDNTIINADINGSAGIAASKLSFAQAGTGAITRTVDSKLKDSVSVKDFGAVGDGVVDDTVAIKAAIAANQGKRIYFPPGTYRFSGNDPEYLGDGTIVFGAGRFSTKIVSIVAAPPSLFYCQGYGSGVESMAFDSEVQQVGGCYVFLGGPESYITDFFMNGDFRGVIMFGNVAQIRHGRFQDAAPNGIRITSGGGDNSQSISNVLMGAQSPPNIAAAGIRLQNSIALTIENTSVIQQGIGLLIDPDTVDQPVLSLYCNQCFFDNCTRPIFITATDGAAVRRLYFTDVWASSGTDGVTIAATTGTVQGIHFTNLQSNLNSGSGVTTGGTGVSQLTFIGGNVASNQHGFFFNQPIDAVEISNMNIGDYDNLGSGNAVSGITFASSGCTNTKIINNSLLGNGAAIAGANNLSTNSRVEGNIGYNPVGISSIAVGASPFTYTAKASPETVYISDGTVSSVTISGQQVLSGSNASVSLGPNESVSVTYTVAPTIKTFVH